MLAKLQVFARSLITDGFLNTFQDEVVALFEGGKTIIKGYVDGVGDNPTSSAIPSLAAGEWRAKKLRATTNGLTVDAGGIGVTAGGISVNDGISVTTGGASIGGNSSITGTLTVSALLTAQAALTVAGLLTAQNGASITGNVDIASGGSLDVGTTGASAGEVKALSLRATTGGVTADAGDIAASSGTLAAGATRASGTPGAGQSLTPGTVSKDTTSRGWADITAAGTFQRGVNVFSVNKPSTGVYVIVLNNGVAMGERLGGTATLTASAGQINVPSASGPVATLNINTYDGSGTPADRAFFIEFKGG